MMKYIPYFEPNKLKANWDKIQYKSSPGVDRINRQRFNRNLNAQIALIANLVLKKNYRFSPYKAKLISKGINSFPRVISIPTIRDKILHKSMNDVLHDYFSQESKHDIVHAIIFELKTILTGNKYDYFLRLDIKDFYPSIKHSKLLTILKNKLPGKPINDLFKNAIKQQTGVTREQLNKNTKRVIRGVPQGLSISNALANIYLADLESIFIKNFDCAFFRYVDDMLILCHESSAENLKKNIFLELKNKGLKINIKKTSNALLLKGFSFLGYEYKKGKLTVKTASYLKIKQSLAEIFTEYRYKKIKGFKAPERWLERKLNWRVTGFIRNKKRYGWLFFFSQIDDLNLLHSLDGIIKRHLADKRFETSEKISIKSFVKTYFFINHKLSRSQKNGHAYIPNFDFFSEQDQRQIFSELEGRDGNDVAAMPIEEVQKGLNRLMLKEERQLEQDVIRMS
jgi:RNA-directed DNA polymerase